MGNNSIPGINPMPRNSKASESVEPPRKNLLQRLFTGDDDAATAGTNSKKKVVLSEKSGSVAAMVTVNGAGHGSAQLGATFHTRTVEEETNSGVTTAKDRRRSIDAPNERSNRFPAMLDRDSARSLAAGMQDGKAQNNFKQTITYSQSGNTVTGKVEGTTHLSGRGGAGDYGLTQTITKTTKNDGDYYEHKGDGWFKRIFGKKEDVATSGEGYRASDQTKIGTLAGDKFVLSELVIDEHTKKPVIDKKTGKPVYTEKQIEKSQVERFVKDGKTVTLFTHELNGENGKKETRSSYKATQNPDDHSKFTFVRLDDAKGFKLAEAGFGSIKLDGHGHLVTKVVGGRAVAGIKPETITAAVNAGVFVGENAQQLDLINKNGKIGLLATTSNQRELSAGGGLSAGVLGLGLFAFGGGQGSKTTAETEAVTDAYTAKLITPHGRFGERIAQLQVVLKDKGYYRAAVDGEAAANGDTKKALDAYFADGGSIKDLDAAAAKAKNNPVVLELVKALPAGTETSLHAGEAKTSNQYIAALIGPDGASGQNILRVQMVLKEKGFYKGDLDGAANARGSEGGFDTVKSLDKYFAKGGSIAALEGLANSDTIKSRSAALAIGLGLGARTDAQMIARKDMPLYDEKGPGATINGHHFDAEAIRKAQEKSVDKIDGIGNDKPIPKNLTTVMIADGNKLKGIDISELGTYGYQIIKGAESVIISIDKDKIYLDPAHGNMVGITITTIENNQVGKTTSTTFQTPVSSLPEILHVPVIVKGAKEHKTEPHHDEKPQPPVKHQNPPPKTPQPPTKPPKPPETPNPPDQPIPNGKPPECCPNGEIPKAIPVDCCPPSGFVPAPTPASSISISAVIAPK